MSRWRAFWLDHDAGPAWRLSLFRVAFFGVVALDQLLRWPLAEAWGQGGFNVAHIGALDALGVVPTPLLMQLLWGGSAALAVAVASGRAPRWLSVLLAVVYTAGWAVSQLDGWQHHYLVVVMLVILAPVDWRRPTHHAWVFRLVLVQLALVYGWSALAKADPRWLDGTLPAAFIGSVAADAVRHAADGVGASVDAAWAAVGWGVLLLEAGLALALPWPRWHRVAWPLAVALHLAMPLAGLRIGRFTWLMLALLVLAMPVRWRRTAR